jgi:predicted MFS family arabinose efflux permease
LWRVPQTKVTAGEDRPDGSFAALRSYNFRLYFVGFFLSNAGEWMQRVGLVWLVLQISNSGVLLGVTAAVQYAPVLLLGMWAGVIADRLDKRRLLLCAQAALIGLSLALWVLTALGVIEMWMVLALAAALGCVKALSRPAEQTFIIEMVSTRNVVNAVGLNSIVFNGARAVGPAVAGVLISSVGLATTFLVNALSYLGIVAALLLIRTAELNPAPRAKRAPGQLRDGLRYVRRSPLLLGTLLLMTTAGIFAYQWEVSLPLLARDFFEGDVNAVASMFMALGVGATLGGLGIVRFLRASPGGLVASGLVFSALLFAVGMSSAMPVTLALLAALGVAHMAFRSTASALLQVRADPEMRGRVVALFHISMVGMIPIGGPLVGWVGEALGAGVALVGGAALTALAATAVHIYISRNGSAARAAPRGPGEVSR